MSHCVWHTPILLSPAAEVPAKAVWVAPGGAARSPGHGGPWGQRDIAAQLLLHLVQLKDSSSSPLKSLQTMQKAAGRVYLGQLQTSPVPFSKT